MFTEYERGGSGHLKLRPDGEGWEFVTNTKDEKKGLRYAICQEEFIGYEFKVTSPAYNAAGEIQKGVAIWARNRRITTRNRSETTMEIEDIVRLGGFEPDDTKKEALEKMVDLVVRIENAKWNAALAEEKTDGK